MTAITGRPRSSSRPRPAMSPAPAMAVQPRARKSPTSAVVLIPPADRSTSRANASALMPRAPQYRNTIAAAAPPHRSSPCGTNGTSSGLEPSAVHTEAAATSAAAITTRRQRRMVFPLTNRSLEGDDQQDDQQDDDDDRRRREDDRVTAGQLRIDLTRLVRRLAQLVTLKRRDGRLSLIDRQPGAGRD